MTRLESRPTKESMGSYCFSIDLEGHVLDERVGEALHGPAPHLRRGALPRVLPAGGPAARDHRPAHERRRLHRGRAWLAGIRDGRSSTSGHREGLALAIQSDPPLLALAPVQREEGSGQLEPGPAAEHLGDPALLLHQRRLARHPGRHQRAGDEHAVLHGRRAAHRVAAGLGEHPTVTERGARSPAPGRGRIRR